MSFLLILLFACHNKASTAEPTADVKPPVASAASPSENDDCPEGVKTGCNVPDVTQADLDANQQVIQECIDACIQSKQAESRGAETIQSDCQSACFEEHFMGQVEVVPTLTE